MTDDFSSMLDRLQTARRTGKPYMTFSQAADLFNMSEEGLRKWLKRGVVPPECYWQPYVGGRYRFDRAKCEKWIRSRT